YQDRHPSSQRHDANPRRRKSPSPIRSRRSSRENNGTDTESVNGVRDVEPNLGANLREQCWLIDSGAITHTSCNRELFTSLDEVSFKIKVANQNCAGGWEGDVHIPGLGRIKEVLFIPEIPYNVLAIIKLSKGTKIEVLFNNGTIQLTNDGKEVGDVIVTSGLAYFIPTMNTTAQVIANFSNDGVKNGKEEGEKDDNADSDTSDEEIEGEKIALRLSGKKVTTYSKPKVQDEYSSDDSSKKYSTKNIPRRSLRSNKGKIPNTLGDYVIFMDSNHKIIISRSANFHENTNWRKIHSNEIIIGKNTFKTDQEQTQLHTHTTKTKPNRNSIKVKAWKEGHHILKTKGTDEYSSDDSSEKNIPTKNIPRRSLRSNKGKIPNTLGD
ncbi:hypothetical protein E2320_022735, partial [Naja naja]